MTVQDSTSGSTRLPLVSGPATITVRVQPYLAYLLALLALGLAGYAWKISHDEVRSGLREHGKLIRLEARFAEMQRQQQRLVDDLGLKSQQLDTFNAKLARWDDTLNTEQRRIWLLNESDHYLRLAQQHLLLTRDVVGARSLLDVADRLLAAHGDNRLLVLRQALAKDRMALSTALSVDVPGIYLRLGSLSERVGALQLPQVSANPGTRHGEGQSETAPPATFQNSSGLLDAGWAKIRALVTIRRYEAPLQPLLSEAARALVREALRLDLAQAQLALMRGEPQVYKASLMTAKARLAHYFPLLPQAEYHSLLQELVTLAAVDIRPALPELAASIRALDALSAQAARVPAAVLPAGTAR